MTSPSSSRIASTARASPSSLDRTSPTATMTSGREVPSSRRLRPSRRRGSRRPMPGGRRGRISATGSDDRCRRSQVAQRPLYFSEVPGTTVFPLSKWTARRTRWRCPGAFRGLASAAAALGRRGDHDLDCVRVRSPFGRRLRYNAYDAFLILAAHQRRHTTRLLRTPPRARNDVRGGLRRRPLSFTLVLRPMQAIFAEDPLPVISCLMEPVKCAPACCRLAHLRPSW